LEAAARLVTGNPFLFNYHRQVQYAIDETVFGSRPLPLGANCPEGMAKKYIGETYIKLVDLLTSGPHNM